MPIRLRYLDWSVGTQQFEELTSAMLRDVYDDNRGHGFLVEQRMHDRVRGRFARRHKVVETVTTPSGETQTFERVEFDYTEFAMRPGRAGIELRNPPRGVGEFQMRLSSLGAHALSIAPVALTMSGFIAELERSLGPAKIRSARLTEVHLGSACTAQVVVRSDGSALKDAEDLVAPRSFRVDRLELAFHVDGQNLRVAVTSAGGLHLGARPSPATVETIWDAVRRNIVQNS